MSRQQLDFFRREGYLVVNQAVSQSFRSALSDRIDVERMSVEGDSLRLDQAFDRFGLASDLLAQDCLVDALTGLIGSTVVVLKNRHNHVTITEGGELRASRLHRDARHWSRGFVTALVPLAARDSRAWIPDLIPGSHLWPIDAPPNGGGYWLDQSSSSWAATQCVQPRMQLGDVLLLDHMTYHRAGVGEPGSPRAMLTMAFAPPNELSREIGDEEHLLIGSHSYHGQSLPTREVI